MTDDELTGDPDEEIHPLQPFPLEPLIGIRPPWHWANLDPDERDFLEATLDLFVTDYNAHLALKPDHLIPACWRQHPYMNQVLPVLFFAWVNSHRTATAAVSDATYFHLRDLPTFRDHLGDYLGPPAPSCRKGVHRDPGDAMKDNRQSIKALEGDPAAATGSPVGDGLHRVSFGTGIE
jgi:hypothetical protein